MSFTLDKIEKIQLFSVEEKQERKWDIERGDQLP